MQVLPTPNLDGIRKALDDNPDAVVIEFPGLNHWLQPSKTGMPEDYGLIETTVDEQVLSTVLDWVKTHVQNSEEAKP